MNFFFQKVLSKSFSGKSSRILTESKKKTDFTSWYELTDVSELNVKVKACLGVSMLLASYLGVTSSNTYEIVFGDITNSNVNSIRVSCLFT